MAETVDMKLWPITSQFQTKYYWFHNPLLKRHFLKSKITKKKSKRTKKHKARLQSKFLFISPNILDVPFLKGLLQDGTKYFPQNTV